MQTTNEFFREISKWKLEAKEEDNFRYFLETGDISDLISGDSCYVIGRKGSGKTAIARHIAGQESFDTFSRTLSFKAFPFRELYKHADDRFTSSQYITFWKFVIYTSICEMMSKNEMIATEALVPLRKHFDIDFGKALQRSIAKITQRNVSLTVLKGGVAGGETKTYMENDAALYERVASLEELICDYIDGSSYYILFDELDEDYKDILDHGRRSQYFDLISSLFKAVSDVRDVFRNKARINPIVFLRDDIYDLVDDNDSNKWDDLSVKLSWSKEKLESLIAFRVSRAIDPDGEVLSVGDIIDLIFESRSIRWGDRGANRRPVLQHVLDRTLMRPRDVISYLRECAEIAYRSNVNSINSDILRRADNEYSRRFKKEFVNEMHTVVPQIRKIFDALSEIRKQVLTVKELRDKYNALLKRHPEMVSFTVACQFLFHFSVIGNQPSQINTNVFKYKHPDAQMNFDEKILVHRGLMKALQIV